MSLYLFDKPINRSIPICLLFLFCTQSFHFKVIWKSLYHFQQVIILATRKHPCSYCIFGHAKNLKQEDKWATKPNNNSIEAAIALLWKKIQNITTIEKAWFSLASHWLLFWFLLWEHSSNSVSLKCKLFLWFLPS